MAKKIEFIFDLESEDVKIASDRSLTLRQEIRLMTNELANLPAGSKQFEIMSKKINDAKDRQADLNIRSREFFGILGSLPGPLGAFGSQLDNNIDLMKTFTSIKTETLSTKFKALGEDMKGIGKGLMDLTGLSKVYAFANDLLGKSFFGVALGEKAAAAGAATLTAALAALGIPLLIAGITLVVDLYKDWAHGAEKAAEKQKELNDMAAKGANASYQAILKFYKGSEEVEIKRKKLAGGTEADIEAIRTKYADLRVKAAKKHLEDLQKIQGQDTTDAAQAVADFEDEKTNLELDAQLRRKGIRDKERQDQKTKDKQLSEQELKNKQDAIAQIGKAEEEGMLMTLSARDRELYTQRKKHSELLYLATKYGLDTKLIIEANRLEEAKINKKYDDADEENRKKTLQKNTDFIKYLSGLTAKKKSEEIQTQLDALKQSNDMVDDDFALDIERNKLRLDLLNKQEAEELKVVGLSEDAKAQIRNRFRDQRSAILQEDIALERSAAQQKTQILLQYMDYVGQIGNMIGMFAGKNVELQKLSIVIEKGVAIAKIGIKLAQDLSFIKGTAAVQSMITPALAPKIAANAAFRASQAKIAAAFAIGAIAAQGLSQFISLNEQGGNSTSADTGVKTGKNMAVGGLIQGPRHAQGGVMINAEGGEAVMTRGAVTMFAPLLSALNQAGGGTSFSANITGQASYDKPEAVQGAIMKTYVVSQELTNDVEKMARLKDLSTL